MVFTARAKAVADVLVDGDAGADQHFSCYLDLQIALQTQEKLDHAMAVGSGVQMVRQHGDLIDIPVDSVHGAALSFQSTGADLAGDVCFDSQAVEIKHLIRIIFKKEVTIGKYGQKT